MQKSGKPKPPTDDKRWRIVDAAMRRYGYKSHALIEALHSVQEAFGFLDKPALEWVALALHVPYSRVYGVATFYNYFTMKPQGEHTCVICTGTACHIKGSDKVLAELSARLKIKPGETTADKKVSLLTARCIGTCGLAPAGAYDGEVVGKLTAEEALTRAERWLQG